VITLDSTGIIALFRERDQYHASAVHSLKSAAPPFVVPTGILSEAAYMLERWSGFRELESLLLSIEEGEVLLDCGEQDFPRIRQLVARYSDLPLGFADATVIACAERRGGLVLTFDQRHFPVVAREGTIQVVGQV
jgi:predicted nucleic acid-binding protein